MTDEEKRIKIAEFCGWVPFPGPNYIGSIALPYHWTNERTEEHVLELPDYIGSLDAMHEAEKSLTSVQLAEYYDALCKIIEAENRLGRFWSFLATAPQRAEALIQTIQ